jgi:DNA-binding NarL/FixJ family response regulator
VTPHMSLRVLLVDDQTEIRSGLRLLLRPEVGFTIAGECADGGEVLAATAAAKPDVVLMDVRMPFVDGIQATRRLQELDDPPPVLALTTFDDDEVLAGMLRAGAAGFILKGTPAEDLQRAVRAVAAGDGWLDPSVTARVLTTYRAATPRPVTAAITTGLNLLTGRERDVLRQMARGLSNSEIAATLVISEGTVKTHINHLFAKLQLRDRATAIVFAHDNGLVG